ncbi:hypothetical protein BU15DRAFT_72508 [Melanogaster broomeanus]|nr:hypothetical protein BU15DRAFT_72508 [Melanogaster broomeanus]
MRTTRTYGDSVRRVASTPALEPSSSNSIEALKEGRRMAKARVMEFVEVNSGMLLILLSQLFNSLMNFSVKVLNRLDKPVPAVEIIAIRMIITYIFCMLYMNIMKIPDPFLGPKGVRLLLVCRGVTGFFGLFGAYYALQYLSLADTTVLMFLSPMVTGVVGHLIMKESYSTRQALASLCSLSGVVLIARPPFLFGNSLSGNEGSDDSPANATPEERLGAVAVALVGVFGITGAYISMRAIGKQAHPMHSVTYFSLWCVIVSSTSMVALKIPVVYPTNWQWAAMLLVVGVFGLTSQTLLTMGLQRETAARGSMTMYIQVVFAVILERVFFGTVPSLFSIIGAAIIITSAIYVIVRSSFTSQLVETTTNVSLDSEDGALEEGLLENRDPDSSDGARATDDDMGSTAEPLVSPHDPEIRAEGVRN